MSEERPEPEVPARATVLGTFRAADAQEDAMRFIRIDNRIFAGMCLRDSGVGVYFLVNTHSGMRIRGGGPVLMRG